jgi:hypothetical protein
VITGSFLAAITVIYPPSKAVFWELMINSLPYYFSRPASKSFGAGLRNTHIIHPHAVEIRKVNPSYPSWANQPEAN